MFSYKGDDRPNVAEIREHPWMSGKLNFEKTRNTILDTYNEYKIASTASGSNRNDMAARGDGLREMIRPADDLSVKKFTVATEFDTDADPGTIYEDLQEFNMNHFDEKM